MIDKLLDLLREIDDVSLDLDEANECGDLELRLKLMLRLEDLRVEHLREKLKETGG